MARRRPPRPRPDASYDAPNPWADAAGYFDEATYLDKEGYFVCLRWKCGDSNTCFANPFDRRGNLIRSNDFLPLPTKLMNLQMAVNVMMYILENRQVEIYLSGGITYKNMSPVLEKDGGSDISDWFKNLTR